MIRAVSIFVDFLYRIPSTAGRLSTCMPVEARRDFQGLNPMDTW
jgi:hypothetical protein